MNALRDRLSGLFATFNLVKACQLALFLGAFAGMCVAPCPGSGLGSGLGQKPATVPRVRSDAKPTFVLKQFSAVQPIRFVAYGDMRFTDPSVTRGTNPRVRQWLVNKVGLERPQVLLLTGDMPFIGEKTADWEEYQRETAPWRAQGFPVFPTIGNHEMYHDPVKGIANYLANYPQLERHRYYSVVLGSVEVIAMDMNLPGGPRSEQYRWLAAQLDHLPPMVDFLLILYHTPWVADTQSQLVAGLPTVGGLRLRSLVEARAASIHAKILVINGHIHNYERFKRHGVDYVVTGGGGAEPYPILFRGSHDLYRDLGFPVYHYLTLEVKDHQLSAVMWKVIDPEAAELNVEVKDRFVIAANPAVPSRRKRP